MSYVAEQIAAEAANTTTQYCHILVDSDRLVARKTIASMTSITIIHLRFVLTESTRGLQRNLRDQGRLKRPVIAATDPLLIPMSARRATINVLTMAYGSPSPK